jgi:hypothetical protein
MAPLQRHDLNLQLGADCAQLGDLRRFGQPDFVEGFDGGLGVE